MRRPSGAEKETQQGQFRYEFTSEPGGHSSDVRGSAYAKRAAGELLASLASAGEGERNQTAFRVAARLIELVNSGWLSAGEARGGYESACDQASSAGRSRFTPAEALAAWRSAAARVGGSSATLPEDTLGGNDFTPAAPPEPPAAAPAPPAEPSPSAFDDPTPHVEPPTAGLCGELLTPEELESDPLPEHLIEGLLSLESGAWLIGAPGSYKSFVALSMMACVGAGEPWLGLRVRRTEVLYVLAEGRGGAGLRFAAWRIKHWRIEGVHILPKAIQMNDYASWQEVVDLAKAMDIGLIVIDTQARVTVGVEENSAKEMGQFVQLVETLKMATGACVMIIHHTGPDGRRGRGSSAVDGAQDTALLLRRPEGTNLLVELTSVKQKDLMSLDEPIRIRMEEVKMGPRPGFPQGVSSLVVAGKANPNEDRDPLAFVGSVAAQDAIVKTLGECGLEVGLTKGEVRRVVLAYGVEDGAFLAAWSHAISIGIIEPSEHGGSKFVLGIAPTGEDSTSGVSLWD